MAKVRMERRAEIGLERRQRTRQKLLDAAAQVLARQGEDATTIDDFINGAGVARGTFYNHFQTRDEILAALWEHVGKSPFRAIQDAHARVSDPAEQLTVTARHILNRARKDFAWGWLMVYLSGRSETLTGDLKVYPMAEITAGHEAGRFTCADVNIARDLVVGAIRTGLYAVLQDEQPEDYAETMCTMILLALGLKAKDAKEVANRPLPALVTKLPVKSARTK